MSSSQGLFFIKCSSMSPFPWDTVLLQCELLSPQILPGLCSSTGLPLESQPPSGIPLLQHGLPSRGCMWISASLCPPGAAGAHPPLHGCTRQSQGYLSSGTWSSSFFSCPALGVCRAVPLIHTPLFHLQLCSIFYPFLNM